MHDVRWLAMSWPKITTFYNKSKNLVIFYSANFPILNYLLICLI